VRDGQDERGEQQREREEAEGRHRHGRRWGVWDSVRGGRRRRGLIWVEGRESPQRLLLLCAGAAGDLFLMNNSLCDWQVGPLHPGGTRS
jgi:hypothetical protein